VDDLAPVHAAELHRPQQADGDLAPRLPEQGQRVARKFVRPASGRGTRWISVPLRVRQFRTLNSRRALSVISMHPFEWIVTRMSSVSRQMHRPSVVVQVG
jgi:hypothetical protein